MTVYVDDMRAQYGRMVMCHMIADTDAELRAMAARIGVLQKWHQGDHFDISLGKRALAVQLGAVEITQRELGCMAIRRRATGHCGSPADAVEWVRSQRKSATFPWALEQRTSDGDSHQ
jgi:hypothetical protein